MRFTPLALPGAHLIELEPIADHRGTNTRAWCAREFAEHGLPDVVAQVNLITNARRGTLRGLHWQHPPSAEAKLFRVTRGAIHDVIIDLRPESPTYRHWVSVELRADRPRLLLVPERFAQGFQTLEDDTELTYQVTSPYDPASGSGMRHDDPGFDLDWPLPVTAISEADRSWPDFADHMAPALSVVGS